MSGATFSHEMDDERQRLKKNCGLEVSKTEEKMQIIVEESKSTLSHYEMDVERQKLR